MDKNFHLTDLTPTYLPSAYPRLSPFGTFFSSTACLP